MCTTYPTTVCSHIIQTELDGSNAKIVWTGDYDSDNNFKGLRDIFTPGIPNGETEQQILVGFWNGSINYAGMRIYDGGEHYQAICHVKIPTLPADGMEIELDYGKMSSIDISKMIYGRTVLENPLIHYKFNEGEGTTIANSANVEPTKYRGTIFHTEGKGQWNNHSIRNCGLVYPHLVTSGKSYNFNDGDYMEVVGSDSVVREALEKDFTIIMWINSSTLNKESVLIRKEGLTGQGGFRLQISGQNGSLRLGIKDPSGGDMQYVSNSPYGSAVGHECMVGFIADSSEIQKIRFISNGSLSQEKQLPINIAQNTGTVRIGASTSSGQFFIGDIGEIQIYNRQLSEFEVQQLYENRLIALTSQLLEVI